MAITVLVTFYSRGGTTEDLAHAAAVGAVQARALIRLRRVPDLDPHTALERYPDTRDTLQRMHKEYIAPRDVDIIAASGLVFASPADIDARSPEWSACFDLLTRLHADGTLAGKVAAVIDNGPACGSFTAALASLGFTVVTAAPGMSDGDSIGRAVALGRQVASAAAGVGGG